MKTNNPREIEQWLRAAAKQLKPGELTTFVCWMFDRKEVYSAHPKTIASRCSLRVRQIRTNLRSIEKNGFLVRKAETGPRGAIDYELPSRVPGLPAKKQKVAGTPSDVQKKAKAPSPGSTDAFQKLFLETDLLAQDKNQPDPESIINIADQIVDLSIACNQAPEELIKQLTRYANHSAYRTSGQHFLRKNYYKFINKNTSLQNQIKLCHKFKNRQSWVDGDRIVWPKTDNLNLTWHECPFNGWRLFSVPESDGGKTFCLIINYTSTFEMLKRFGSHSEYTCYVEKIRLAQEAASSSDEKPNTEPTSRPAAEQMTRDAPIEPIPNAKNSTTNPLADSSLSSFQETTVDRNTITMNKPELWSTAFASCQYKLKLFWFFANYMNASWSKEQRTEGLPDVLRKIAIEFRDGVPVFARTDALAYLLDGIMKLRPDEKADWVSIAASEHLNAIFKPPPHPESVLAEEDREDQQQAQGIASLGTAKYGEPCESDNYPDDDDSSQEAS